MGKKSASNPDNDKTKGPDVVMDIEVDFMGAITGCDHSFEVVRDTT